MVGILLWWIITWWLEIYGGCDIYSKGKIHVGWKYLTSVGDSSHKIDAIFLHFFVSILQDRGKSRQKILNRWSHLGHSDHIDDCLKGTKNGAQDLWVFFTQVFVKDHLCRTIKCASVVLFLIKTTPTFAP